MAKIDLLTDVEAALGMALHADYATKAEQHDLFEAYVLTLLLEAAKATGWTLSLRDGWGRAVTAPLFRRGPGRLTSRKFTFAHMTKPGKRDLEAHLGVKVAGLTAVDVSPATASGHLLHEFDLLVLPSDDADACRASGDDPDHSMVVAHAEMKYHGGSLPLPLGRASVGMAGECVLAGKSVLVTNRMGLTVQDLVEHHGVMFRYRVTPASTVAEGHVRNWFETVLRSAP